MRLQPTILANAPSTQRRGVALLWLIIALPALLLFLVLVVEIGNLWLARLELEQSLEASALAAAKQWAETNDREGTEAARIAGNDFAKANLVRGMAVDLTNADLNAAFNGTLNYGTSAINGNQVRTDVNSGGFNASGVLVFGGVTLPDEGTGYGEVIFDADEEPKRLVGANVLLDVSQNGSTNENNRWGIAFRTSPIPHINEQLRITRIVIDVDPDNTATSVFANSIDPMIPLAELSDNSSPKVNSGSESQPDHFGLDSAFPSTQIVFSAPTASTVQIDFFSNGSDDGFGPGDRFRFDTTVVASPGGTPLNADVLGQIGTEIRVFFTIDGEPWPEPLVARLSDTDESGCTSDPTWEADHLDNLHLVVHPSGEFDLPCPPGGPGSGNGQSYVVVHSPEGPREYGVRAQASISIPSVCKSLGGIPLGPFGVTAGATAVYDPRQEEPRLIRPDQFLFTP